MELKINEIDGQYYLTDDSPIKEGDWDYVPNRNVIEQHLSEEHVVHDSWEKVKATTDPKLIADGVPAISQADLPKIADALNKGVTSVGCEISGKTGRYVGDSWDNMKTIIDSVSYKTKDRCIVLDWGESLGREIYNEMSEEQKEAISKKQEAFYFGGQRMYTKEEVEEFVKEALKQSKTPYSRLDIDGEDKWIKDNLK